MDNRPHLPYPGLRPFERHERGIFFGRDRQIDELLELLGHHHFLAVVGTSGCGKSSLVRTGLITGLKGGMLARAGARWRIAEMRPGGHPFDALADALLHPEALGDAWAAPFADREEARAYLLTTLRRGPKGLAEVMRQSRLEPGTTLLLIVDQFEELFRYSAEGESRAAFVQMLLEAARHPDLYICLTMRSDFLGDCARFHNLPEAINRGLYLTPRLDRDQLRQAIAAPARPFGGKVEPGVVNKLVNAVSADPDQLPILQDALMRMWGLASGIDAEAPRITAAELEAVGGLREALSNHADRVYDDLNAPQQALAETLFRCLTERETEGRDTRRPTPLGAIAEVAGVEWPVMAEVVEAFRAPGHHFITPPPGVELDEETTLDIAHESLIRQWRLLRGWVEKEAEAADEYRRLAGNAARWPEEAALLHSPDLENALLWYKRVQPTPQWAERYDGDLKRTLRYLDESRVAKEAEVAAEEVERQRKLLLARRITSGALIALLITGLLGGWGWLERQNAREAAVEAELERKNAQQAAIRAEEAEQQRTTSLFDAQLTHASLLTRVEDYAEARRVLREGRQFDDAIPAPRRHARNLLAGYVEIMGGEAEQVYEGAGAQLSGGVAVSPDGRLLAAAGERGTLALFDAKSGELLQRLEGHDPKAGQLGGITSVVFAPQAHQLFSAGEDRRIIRWRLSEGGRVAVKDAEWQSDFQVMALAISPDGTILASGDIDGETTLWAAASREPEGERIGEALEGHTGAIASPNGLAFSPDGKRLASAAFDKTANVWNWEKGEPLLTLKGHNHDLEAVAFSPDGKRIATASDDKGVILWNADTGRPLRLLRGHTNIVFDITFTTDGRHLLSASRDNTLRLWDVESGVTQRVYQGHRAGLLAVALHDDTLYSAAADATLRRWSFPLFTRSTATASPTSTAPGVGHAPSGRIPDATPSSQWLWELPGEPTTSAIPPDAKLVAVGFADGALRLYPLPTKGSTEHRVPITPLLNRNHVLNIEGNKAHPNPLTEVADAHSTIINRIAFSPDGTLIATSSHDNTAKLWGLEQGEHGPTLRPLHTLTGHSSAVHAVAFSPDGTLLATAGYDGRIGLLSLDPRSVPISTEATPSPKPPTERPLTFIEEAHQGVIANIAFGGDGNILLSTGADELTLRLWDLTTTPPTLTHELPKAKDVLLWAALRPDGREIAAVGRELVVNLHNLDAPDAPPRPLVGHEQAVFRAAYTPDGRQLATISGDMTLRLWDLEQAKTLFTLRLPTQRDHGVPLWDFDLRCATAGHCWIAVPLTMGRLALYRLPYEKPPASLDPE